MACKGTLPCPCEPVNHKLMRALDRGQGEHQDAGGRMQEGIHSVQRNAALTLRAP